MKRNKILAILTIAVFAFSVSGHVATVSSQNDIEVNFDILLMTNAGNRIRESYAFFIKQAVAPLGIDVEILAKPFGQFVGDLLHLSTGQPFDLAIIGFAGGGPTPSFMWKFHSTDTSFGQDMYQLNDPSWQDFQEADIGLTTAEIDAQLEAIDFELDPITRQAALSDFAQLYMDQLLYDLPLTTVTSRVAMWAGFGEADTGDGVVNELWDEDEGTWASSWLGATWETNPTERQDDASASTLQFRIADPGSPGLFDPYQSFDTSTTAQTTYSTMNLLTFDGSFSAHPGVAYQWFIEDVVYDADQNASTPDELVESGKHTFIIDSSKWTWPATTDYQGNAIPSEAVDANDIALVFEMFKNPMTTLNGKELYNPVTNWEVSTTVSTDDTISIWLDQRVTPDDYVTLGAITPLPDHILGGDLNVDDPNTEGLQPNGTVINMGTTNFTAQAFNPQRTVEWQYWGSEAGNTLIGPMEINEFALASGGGFFDFTARADFPFPNEWDVMEIYAESQANKDALDALYASANSTGWAGNTSTFAPHAGVLDEAYYFAFADDPNTAAFERPTAQLIDTVVVKNIADTNAALLAFESGGLDAFGSSSLGANTVEDHENDDRFVVRTTLPISGPQLLVFNLLNEHLQKRNVRYAIASVIDRQEMTKINDGFASVQHSPVWLVYERFAPPALQEAGLSWYEPFVIPYDYAEGRDLMRLEGYEARDTNEPVISAERPPVENVISTIAGALGPELLLVVSAFSMISISLIRRKRFD